MRRCCETTSSARTVSEGTVPALPSPKRVSYMDTPDSWWPVSDTMNTVKSAVDAGYSIIILVFWQGSGQTGAGPYDMAKSWSSDAYASYQQSIVDYSHTRGAIVMVSARGGEDKHPYIVMTSAGYGKAVGSFALNKLDGVDLTWNT